LQFFQELENHKSRITGKSIVVLKEKSFIEKCKTNHMTIKIITYICFVTKCEKLSHLNVSFVVFIEADLHVHRIVSHGRVKYYVSVYISHKAAYKN
jgi:hypothetical protein